MSKTIWLGAVAYNPKVVTIWEGMRRYFHEEAHLPVEVVLFQSYEAQVLALLAQPGEATPRIDIAWNTNLAYLQADEWSSHACRAIAMRDKRRVPEGGLREIWSSPAYNHCMFTTRPDFNLEQQHRFVEALLAMSYDNPIHRPILDAEGLQRWLLPHVDGYAALREAAAE